MALIQSAAERLKELISSADSTLYLRGTCKDLNGDIFKLTHEFARHEILSVDVVESGGFNSERAGWYNDTILDGPSEIQAWVSELLEEHEFELVDDSQLTNVKPAFSVNSPEFFVSHNTLQIATGKELVSPWNTRNLREFIKTFISLRLPLSYRQLFERPWMPPFLRGMYEQWDYLIADSASASGITFTVVPKGVSIIWFPPLFPSLYTKSTKLLLQENLVDAKTFDSNEIDIKNLQLNTTNPVIFDLDILSISSSSVKKLVENSLMSFAVVEIERTSTLDEVTRSRLEGKVRRAASKLHAKNTQSGSVICIPAAGRSIMILKNGG
jgi:hypothetical protein